MAGESRAKRLKSCEDCVNNTGRDSQLPAQLMLLKQGSGAPLREKKTRVSANCFTAIILKENGG